MLLICRKEDGNGFFVLPNFLVGVGVGVGDGNSGEG